MGDLDFAIMANKAHKGGAENCMIYVFTKMKL